MGEETIEIIIRTGMQFNQNTNLTYSRIGRLGKIIFDEYIALDDLLRQPKRRLFRRGELDGKPKVKAIKIIQLLTIFFISACSAPTSQMISEGGPCEYKTYEGRAIIISITQKTRPSSSSHETFEVKFSFDSDQNVTEKFAHPEGKEFVLLLNNSEYPERRFLEKYDIQVGKVFECHMKVIIKGTCTPIIFEFPKIRLDDYLEK